jgi:exopolyphosphatase/guanosine-5'-triphosphate,3'-diphosphate pyrophosphatase
VKLDGLSSAAPRESGGAALRAGAGPPQPAARPETLAALDLGTNNCRLLIARGGGGTYRILEAFSRITRLGEGLAGIGRLSEAAMARTIDALKVCAVRLAYRGVGRGRYIATEACRRAENCTEFLDRVRQATGINLEIIGTEEEARLAVAGCAPLLERRIPYALVFDIGGGSTELVWLHQAPSGPEVLGVLSLPFGVVNLTERFGGDRIAGDAYERMVEEVAADAQAFEEAHGIGERVASGEVQMLGSSGTVTTLAGIHLGLPRYNRSIVDGSTMSFAAIDAVTRHLSRLDLAQRARLPCVGPDRADLVVAGCAILEAICVLWPVGRLRVADRGVREGILLDLSTRPT